MGNKWKEIQGSNAYVTCLLEYFLIFIFHCFYNRFRKIDSTLTDWKTKLEDNEKYQKTKTSLNEGGKKASATLSSTATTIK